MDTSRLTPQQIQMQMNKIRNEQQKEQNAKEQQNARDRSETKIGTGYRGLYDLMNSDLYKKSSEVLSNNRKKEYLQRQFNTTVDDLDSNQLNDFVKTVKDT